jgi:hypothetical protein
MILQTDIVVIGLYRHLMRNHMTIPRENREYSPGERDLDLWQWLTGLSDGSFGFVSNSVGVTLSAPAPLLGTLTRSIFESP